MPSDNSLWMQIHPKHGIAFMDHLYNVFNAIYMNRWRMEFPDAASVESWRTIWADRFDKEKLTLEQVGAGLDKCAEAHPSFPPSLWEFVKLCKEVKPAAHRDFEKVTEKLSPEQMAENRKRIRGIIESLSKSKRMSVER